MEFALTRKQLNKKRADVAAGAEHGVAAIPAGEVGGVPSWNPLAPGEDLRAEVGPGAALVGDGVPPLLPEGFGRPPVAAAPVGAATAPVAAAPVGAATAPVAPPPPAGLAGFDVPPAPPPPAVAPVPGTPAPPPPAGIVGLDAPPPGAPVAPGSEPTTPGAFVAEQPSATRLRVRRRVPTGQRVVQVSRRYAGLAAVVAAVVAAALLVPSAHHAAGSPSGVPAAGRTAVTATVR